MKLSRILTSLALIITTNAALAYVPNQTIVTNNVGTNLSATYINSCQNGACPDYQAVVNVANKASQSITLPNPSDDSVMVNTILTSVSVGDHRGKIYNFYNDKTNYSPCISSTNAGDENFAGSIELFMNPANASQLCCKTNTTQYCFNPQN